jgi:hypothetical protein
VGNNQPTYEQVGERSVFFSALIGLVADMWRKLFAKPQQRSQRENSDDLE